MWKHQQSLLSVSQSCMHQLFWGVSWKSKRNWKSYFSSSEEAVYSTSVVRIGFLAVEREKWRKFFVTEVLIITQQGCKVLLTLALKFNSRQKEWQEQIYFCIQAETVWMFFSSAKSKRILDQSTLELLVKFFPCQNLECCGLKMVEIRRNRTQGNNSR